MRSTQLARALPALLVLAAACKRSAPPALYEPVPVARRDIVVAANANGGVEPILIVDVKSRASGTILEMRVETGDMVHKGDTLVKVDRRDPTTAFNQANADLEVATAQVGNALAQKNRADQMFQAGVLSEQDHDNANLAYANAQAQLVRAQATLQSAQDALTDCNVLAPSDGTILVKNVEAGGVITSAVRDVSGGTVLLRMADLGMVQVRGYVDETDVGKVQPGMPVTVSVDAYPNRPFQGTVLKIEPQSTVQQNVTMFSVLIRIPNPEGLLRPGMNTEIAIQIGQRLNVLAIPTSALRTPRDVASAAQVLGLDPKDVDRQLAMQDSLAQASPQLAAVARDRQVEPAPSRGGRESQGGSVTPLKAAVPPSPVAANSTAVRSPMGSDGQRFGGAGAGQGGFQLPPGVTQEQLGELRRKRMNNEPLTAQDSAVMQTMRQFREQQGGGQGFAQGQPQEQAILQQAMRRFQQGSGNGGGQGRRRFGEGNNYQFGGTYIVFVLRNGKPAPARVRTGLTDMDFSEVLSGVGEKDTVLLLPSASLVQQQADMRDRMQRMAGGGVPGMQQGSAPRTGGPGR